MASWIKPLSAFLNESEQENLLMNMNLILHDSLSTLKETIEVNPDFESTGPRNTRENPEALMQQYREQNKMELKQEQRIQEMAIVHQRITQADRQLMMDREAAKELPFSNKNKENTFMEEQFASEIKKPTFEINEKAEIWSVNQVLKDQMGKIYKEIFDEKILTTSNFAVSFINSIDLLGISRKKPGHWLLICDELVGEKQWKLIFCSVRDAVIFKKHLLKTVPPKGRTLYLMRANSEFKATAVSGESPLSMAQLSKESTVKKLMAQALFFSGNFRALSQKKWLETLNDLMPSASDRKDHQKYFEELILSHSSANYLSSKLYKFWHK